MFLHTVARAPRSARCARNRECFGPDAAVPSPAMCVSRWGVGAGMRSRCNGSRERGGAERKGADMNSGHTLRAHTRGTLRARSWDMHSGHALAHALRALNRGMHAGQRYALGASGMGHELNARTPRATSDRKAQSLVRPKCAKSEVIVEQKFAGGLSWRSQANLGQLRVALGCQSLVLPWPWNGNGMAVAKQ